MRYLAPALLCVAALTSCARYTTAPVSLSAALSGVESQLRTAGALSAADLRTNAQVAQFDAAARSEQCAAGQANPIVPVLDGPIALDLSGQFTTGGAFTVSNPLQGLGGNLSRVQGQTVSVSISEVPLSGLPGLYLARDLKPLAGLDKALAADPQRRAANAAGWLTRHVDGLISSWASTECGFVRPH